MIATTTLLNKVGAELAQDDDVHAITDVTGFGLLGHALEMARGAKSSVTIDAVAVPLLSDAASLAQKGFVTGASRRNWSSYREGILWPDSLPDWYRHLLTDPQTSGGLLVSCSHARANTILSMIKAQRYPAARVVGRAKAGAPVVSVQG
jgi:selenide,water dikinase